MKNAVGEEVQLVFILYLLLLKEKHYENLPHCLAFMKYECERVNADEQKTITSQKTY